MDDLAQFIRRRLDEREARARALPDGPWAWQTFGGGESDALVGPGGTVLSSGDTSQYGSWIDRHAAFDAYLQDIQPARMLDEIDAARRILDVHRPYVNEPDQACLGCAGGIVWGKCPVLRLLALPYASHPDYRDEWRP